MRTHGFLSTSAVLLVGLLVGCQDKAQQAELRGGYAALDQKHYDQALQSANNYLRQNPSGAGAAEAMYLRGRAIEQRVKGNQAEARANLLEARTAYQKVLSLNPSSELLGSVQASLGNVSYWLDDYAAAEVHWTEALRHIDRGDLAVWILFRVGLCQQRLGKWASADATFASIQKDYPNTEVARRAASQQGTRDFYVQVAVFQNMASADNMVRELRGKGFPAVRLPKPERNLQWVKVGPLRNYAEAIAMRDRLAAAGHKDALIVP